MSGAAPRFDRPERVPWAAVGVYIAVAYGLAWLVAAPLWLHGGLRNPLAGILLIAMMYTPAIAALFVVFVVQRPRPVHVAEYLGVAPFRPARRIIGLALIGMFGSILVALLSVLLAAAVGAIHLDLVTFSHFAQIVRAQLAAVHTSVSIPVGLIVLLQLIAIPVGGLLNSVATVGEELGWRGWLLPSLRPLGTARSLLLTGLIWGLWHSPIILLGYNFGEPNAWGLLFMVLGCVTYGVLIGWLRLRSASLWPSVLAHGAFNASAGVGTLLLAAGAPIPPVDYIPLGWPGWVVCALMIGVLALLRQFRIQPTLDRKGGAS